jgi:hypothetical protein
MAWQYSEVMEVEIMCPKDENQRYIAEHRTDAVYEIGTLSTAEGDEA